MSDGSSNSECADRQAPLRRNSVTIRPIEENPRRHIAVGREIIPISARQAAMHWFALELEGRRWWFAPWIEGRALMWAVYGDPLGRVEVRE